MEGKEEEEGGGEGEGGLLEYFSDSILCTLEEILQRL